MKLFAGLIGALCLLVVTVHADTLRISIDTNWVQPYVVAGNSNEIVARVILDGTSLERDVHVNDIPLTLILSNMPYSAFTNCVLWGHPHIFEGGGVDSTDNPRSYPLEGNFLNDNNTFHFPWPPRVIRGEQRILYLTCGISRASTNGSFRWGMGSEYTTTLCTFSPSVGIVCTAYTNQIDNPDGSVTDVQLVQGHASWIPVIAMGGAKLSISIGEIDYTGAVRPGQIMGKGRPYRKYTIDYSYDFRDWYSLNLWIDISTGHFYSYVEADSAGNFSSSFYTYIRQQRAKFFRAYEEFE